MQDRSIHTIRIIAGLNAVLATALHTVDHISIPIDTSSDKDMLALIKTAIGTKFVARWSDLMCSLALKAVRTVTQGGETHSVGGVQVINGMTTIDIKRYARDEKVPGGTIEESQVLSGVLINKDITHPKMRRRTANPRIILLDCPLEYKKGESQTNIEISKEEDWARILEIEEEQIKKVCEKLIEFKPDLVITEKGVSDLAQHYLLKANITALRRVRKSDNNRITRATGATIVNRVENLRDSDVGTQCGMFYIEKMGDECVGGYHPEIGGHVIRVLTKLRAKHAAGEHTWGIDGHVGKITDMKTYGLYESASVKIQTLKTAIEATRVLLRVDDIVQATRKDKSGGGGRGAAAVQDMGQGADGEGGEPEMP
ncbi:T-complex protein 1 subunit gamma Short=TCP-1-gamma [Rhizoctonia solani AG-1 IB]|uniref:T-complex protein 1 subunit gamma n=1 Tax=Thanatephorus cucumeris (strain AG1-IB / isolate 7/3/14) TaxID=1108050 RepID=M5C9X9_THACB|nr:T-complex protein 1 subunit gamma Short=TCP-1-gamma [Rhizoctonia solani AG-1 IB]